MITRPVVCLAAALWASLETFSLSTIEIKTVGTEVEVTWTGGVLQTAPAAAGPWSPVGGAVSPHRLPAGQRAFFRVHETYMLTVTKEGSGAGTVRSVPTGIDCGADCSEVVLSGQTFTLQAQPEAGSTFAGWSGDCTGTGDCQAAMNSPKTVTATFTKPSAPANPLINGGFEEGPQSGWQQNPGQLIYSSAELGVPAHSGQYMARLGYEQDGRRIAQIGQQVTLPSTTPLYLNFALWVYSEELCDVPWYDRITVYVGGQVAVRNERICRSSDTDGWERVSLGLDALAGQTVAIVFEIYSADALTSILLLDDISISSQVWQ